MITQKTRFYWPNNISIKAIKYFNNFTNNILEI